MSTSPSREELSIRHKSLTLFLSESASRSRSITGAAIRYPIPSMVSIQAGPRVLRSAKICIWTLDGSSSLGPLRQTSLTSTPNLSKYICCRDHLPFSLDHQAQQSECATAECDRLLSCFSCFACPVQTGNAGIEVEVREEKLNRTELTHVHSPANGLPFDATFNRGTSRQAPALVIAPAAGLDSVRPSASG
jgi:hypothetical protein